MSREASAWVRSFRAFIAGCRERDPLPSRESLSPAQEFQCRIIGGSLCTWLDRWGPQVLQQRAALHRAAGVEEQALVVFTSDVAGLAAAAEIVDPRLARRVVFLRADEYEEWISEHPDELRFHVHTWSTFRVPPEKELLSRARRRFELIRGEEFWQHSEGTLWAPLAGQAADHLWAWDREVPRLLEEAFESRVF
jgi:hypothetical protein